MCDQAAHLIARKAVTAAQAEWELLQAIALEEKAHPGTAVHVRRLLEARKDDMALAVFDWALGIETPGMEKARALVDG